MDTTVTQPRPDNQARPAQARATWLFLCLTAAFSVACYVPLILSGLGSPQAGALQFALMWSPGLAAVITCLICYHSLRSLGWRPGRIGYLALAYVLPVLYCLVAYSFGWLTGLASRGATQGPPAALGLSGGSLSPGVIGLIAIVVGSIGAVFSGLGEELGWRGFLVPHLAARLPFAGVALLSGIIWAAWHYPYILFTDIIRQQLPVWYALPMFTLVVIGISFAFAWLRLRSGSVWPAAVLHGSHNLFMLHVFNAMTQDTGHTWYYLGEYGLVTAVTLLIAGGIFWRLRG